MLFRAGSFEGNPGAAAPLEAPPRRPVQPGAHAGAAKKLTVMDSPQIEHSTQGMAGVVDRNIQALLSRRSRQEQQRAWQERVADRITAFTGSMAFVWIHLVVFGLWIAINAGWLPGLPRFDSTFVILAMAASVEAIFLSTFVLITQNRMQALADQRADLDLQISLLAEHEITRLLNLVCALAERMGVEQSRDPELKELSQDIEPEQVLDKLDQRTRRRQGPG